MGRKIMHRANALHLGSLLEAGAPQKMVIRLREELLVLCQGVCGEVNGVKLKIQVAS